MIWGFANGFDTSPVRDIPDPEKSISNSRTFP